MTFAIGDDIRVQRAVGSRELVTICLTPALVRFAIAERATAEHPRRQDSNLHPRLGKARVRPVRRRRG